jgi:hypothetical protein
MRNLADEPECASLLDGFRRQLEGKMASLGDTFPESTWYRQHWIEDRIIKRTATLQ